MEFSGDSGKVWSPDMRRRLEELLALLVSGQDRGAFQTERDRLREEAGGGESDIAEKIRTIDKTIPILTGLIKKDYSPTSFKSVSTQLWSNLKVAIDAIEDLDSLIRTRNTRKMLENVEECFYEETWKEFEEEIFSTKLAELQRVVQREQSELLTTLRRLQGNMGTLVHPVPGLEQLGKAAAKLGMICKFNYENNNNAESQSSKLNTVIEDLLEDLKRVQLREELDVSSLTTLHSQGNIQTPAHQLRREEFAEFAKLLDEVATKLIFLL